MKAFFENMFCLFYKLAKKGKDEDAGISISILWLWILVFLNVSSLYIFLNKLLMNSTKRYSEVIWIFNSIFVLLFLLYYFVYKKRYIEIIKKYSNQKKEQIKRAKLLIWLYIFSSIILLVFSISFYHKF